MAGVEAQLAQLEGTARAPRAAGRHWPWALSTLPGPAGSLAPVQGLHHPNFPAIASCGHTRGRMNSLQSKKRNGQRRRPDFAFFGEAEQRLSVHSRWMYQTQTLFYYCWMEVSANNQMSFPIFCVSLCDADRGNPNVSKQAVPICSRQTISKCISSTESIEK